MPSARRCRPKSLTDNPIVSQCMRLMGGMQQPSWASRPRRRATWPHSSQPITDQSIRMMGAYKGLVGEQRRDERDVGRDLTAEARVGTRRPWRRDRHAPNARRRDEPADRLGDPSNRPLGPRRSRDRSRPMRLRKRRTSICRRYGRVPTAPASTKRRFPTLRSGASSCRFRHRQRCRGRSVPAKRVLRVIATRNRRLRATGGFRRRP